MNIEWPQICKRDGKMCSIQDDTKAYQVTASCCSISESYFKCGDYLNISKHFDEVVGSATQCQVVQDVLVHELDVRVTELHGAIGVPVTN